jgi:hypothetical protein
LIAFEKMVSNYYIDNVLQSFKSFKGTFSSDNIPILEKNESVICNFSKVGEEGSHFIYIINKDNNLFYFDSLKLPFLPKDVAAYFLHYQNVTNVSKRIQHPDSSFCGFYCVMAFLACIIDVSFFVNDVLPVFKECVMENDNKCIKIIQCLFPLAYKKEKNE